MFISLSQPKIGENFKISKSFVKIGVQYEFGIKGVGNKFF